MDIDPDYQGSVSTRKLVMIAYNCLCNKQETARQDYVVRFSLKDSTRILTS